MLSGAVKGLVVIRSASPVELREWPAIQPRSWGAVAVKANPRVAAHPQTFECMRIYLCGIWARTRGDAGTRVAFLQTLWAVDQFLAGLAWGVLRGLGGHRRRFAARRSSLPYEEQPDAPPLPAIYQPKA
jgi:hypothetical protein